MSSAGPAYHCDPSYLNRLVMNYLVVEGYRDAAVHFERESGTPPRVDPRTIHEVLRPRDFMNLKLDLHARERWLPKVTSVLS